MRLLSAGSVAILSALGLISACHVENYGHRGHWAEADDTASPGEVCGKFCTQLFTCGNIGPSSFETCIDGCKAEFKADEDTARDGCKCVIKQSCQPDGGYGCAGAPMSKVTGTASPSTTKDAGSTAATDAGSSGSAGSGSGSAGSGSGSAATGADSSSSSGSGQQAAGVGKGGGYVCTAHKDCALSEDCVLGYCLVRCKASCECHVGETCITGYCSLPVAPPKACTVDCECPAGGKCVAGACK
ncbi:MAG: hypothetical protein FJ100_06650 [Deltaproteobacteria bacterium]|nr:hypothetical protein [Deltaproteobacteria bacterium]